MTQSCINYSNPLRLKMVQQMLCDRGPRTGFEKILTMPDGQGGIMEDEANAKRKTTQARVACLSCRKKHLKCDGTNPCKNCTDRRIECVFIGSRRGGSRVKKPKVESPDGTGHMNNGTGAINVSDLKNDTDANEHNQQLVRIDPPTSTELTPAPPANSLEKTYKDYYNIVHQKHPFLPEKDVMGEIPSQDCDELLMAMSMTVDVVNHGKSTRPLWEACESKPDDAFKLHALLLGYICGKILFSSTCEDFRNKAIDIALGISNLDDFLAKTRTRKFANTLKPSLVRCLSELYVLDNLISASSGMQFPRMTNFDCTMLDQTDIKYKCATLIRDIVCGQPFIGRTYESIRKKLTLLEGEVMMRGLVDNSGKVDDTTFFSTAIVNFAKMLLNQPFARTEHNVCSNDNGYQEDGPHQNPPLNNEAEFACYSASIEIIQLLSRLGIKEVLTRTPLYCCSLMQAMVFHLRHFYWLTFNDNFDINDIVTNITLGSNFLTIAKNQWPIANVLLERFNFLLNKRAPVLAVANKDEAFNSPMEGPPINNQDSWNELNFNELEAELFNFMDQGIM